MKSNRMKIVAVQMKFRSDADKNVEFIRRSISQAAAAGADVVLFPECAVTGYACDFDAIPEDKIQEALSAISAAAREANCNVLVGSPTYQGAKRLNSLVVFNRKGRAIFTYSKLHLTKRDEESFSPGDRLAFFKLDGIPCTAIICHERRYPELVRIPVMMGARIIFHPNAGLDSLEVSKTKRKGRDGIVARAFENEVYYVFANSVGPQGGNLWSAGDSKIIAPDSTVLALADNRKEMLIQAVIDPALAGRKYAIEALKQPAFLRGHWKRMIKACKAQVDTLG